MIGPKDIHADLHVHTLFSLHAHSTIKECIDESVKNGIQFLAITDHFYADGTILNQKNEITRLVHMADHINKKSLVHIIDGAEFNVGQYISAWGKLSRLKWKLFGVHGWFLNINETTLDNLKDFYRKDGDKFNAWAHIERELHKIDHGRFGSVLTCEVKDYLDFLVNLAKERNVFLEVNESSLVDDVGGNRSRINYWLQVARENGNMISLGTDSHYCEEIGHFDNVMKILNELDYPKERIINCNIDILRNL